MDRALGHEAISSASLLRPARPERLRLALALVVLLQAAAPPAHALELVRGPYLQQGTPDSMIVRWRTDVASESTLRYGPSFDDLSNTISLPGPATEHEIPITNLQPSTRYYYSVGTSTQVLAGVDAFHYFETSPRAGAPRSTRLWVIGDSGQNTPKSAMVRDQYLAFAGPHLANLFLMLGDNAYLDGTDAEHTSAIFENYPTVLRNTILWPAPGNHEFTSTPGSSNATTETGPYFDAFTLPTQAEAGGVPSGTELHYSFDYANIHFVALNTYNVDVRVGSEVYDWLVADLEATDQRWVIVFMHMAPYSSGSRESDTDVHMINTRTLYNPVFEDKGVDLVLGAHSHTYERSMLIDGHYGVSGTFGPEHIVDGGDGDPLGDGPYHKTANGPVPHLGTVYVVNGVGENAYALGNLDHPVMVTSHALEGSMVIDIEGATLDAYFISSTGDMLDRFQITKSVPVPTGDLRALCALGLALGLLGTLAISNGSRSRARSARPRRECA